MRLSIVIVTLNEERNLPRCLEAIAGLDHAGFAVETVVADGASSDGTRAVAERAGVPVVSGPRGVSRQRNAGAHAVTGEVLAFIDADVELLPGWFETVHRHFPDSSACRKVLGGPRLLGSDVSWVARAHAMALNPAADTEPAISHDSRFVTTQSLVIGRGVFQEVGGFREDLQVAEDTALVLDAEQVGAEIVSDPRLRYIHHGEPATLGQFFRHVLWHTDWPGWARGLGDPRSPFARTRKYTYGLVVTAELAALGASLAAGPVGWVAGVPAAIAALGLTFTVPALRTALRHGQLGRVGELGLMYGAYGTALAAALLGAGRNKERHFRRSA